MFPIHLFKHPLCKHNRKLPFSQETTSFTYFSPSLDRSISDQAEFNHYCLESLKGIVFCVIISYINPDKWTLDEAMVTFLLDLL